MKKTMKRNVVLSSILAIVLCVSLIAGGTFALFTSESKVNIAVTSGKVKVEASIEGLTLYSPTAIAESGITNADNIATATHFGNGGTAVVSGNTLTLTNVIPGDKALFNIVIVNNSNVNIKYRTVIACDADNGLFAGLVFTIGEASVTGKTEWTPLAAGADIDDLACTVELPAGSGNDYQEKTCTISFTVEAVQGNAEMPVEWDGESSTTPSDPNGWSDNEYHITSAEQFVGLMERTSVGDTNSWALGKTIVLDCDIDFGGRTITGIGSDEDNITFTFKGNNHTIKNFKIDNGRGLYAGLFNQFSGHVESLTVENATVIGDRMVGIIASNVEGGGSIVDCHVKNCLVVSNIKKAGAITGYSAGGNVTDCTAENVEVYCADTDVNESNQIVGFVNNGEGVAASTIERNDATNVNVYRGATYAEVATAAQLKAAVARDTNTVAVRLLNDITVSSDWTPIEFTFYANANKNVDHLIIDGDNHSIIGLPSALVIKVTSGRGKLTVKDLTVKAANINGGTYQNGMGNAAIVAFVENGSVELNNCHVIDSSIKDTTASAAALIGYVANTSAPDATIVVTGCSVKNTEVKSTVGDAAAILAYAHAAKMTITNFTYSDLIVSGRETEKTGVYIGTANAGSVINITGAPADHTGLIGRNYNSLATINYN